MTVKAPLFNLGDEVTDTVTKFRGIITARTECLNGCWRYHIQPPVDKDHKMLDAYIIDEMQLKLEKADAIAPTLDKSHGGPMERVPR